LGGAGSITRCLGKADTYTYAHTNSTTRPSPGCTGEWCGPRPTNLARLESRNRSRGPDRELYLASRDDLSLYDNYCIRFHEYGFRSQHSNPN